MKRIALLLASTVVAGPAFAADVVYNEPPAPAPVEVAAPIANWTGFYVGGQAGVAFGGSNSGFSGSTDPEVGAGTFSAFGSDQSAGFIGGVHVGYDYQLSNNIVIGALADINYIDGNTNRDFSFGGQDFSDEQQINYLGTVRAKVGYALDRVLPYVTGGLAYANVDNSFSGPTTFTAPSGTTYTATVHDDSNDFGYTVGGGLDFLVTDNISIGAEYLYTNLGKNDFSVDYVGNNGASFTSSSNDDVDFHTVFAKVSYRFK